jgi:hypothetical protein
MFVEYSRAEHNIRLKQPSSSWGTRTHLKGHAKYLTGYVKLEGKIFPEKKKLILDVDHGCNSNHMQTTLNLQN